MDNRQNKFLRYVIDRLSETSTWKGAIVFAIGAGLKVEDYQADALITFGPMLIGAIGMLLPDNLGDTVAKLFRKTQ